MDSFSRLWNSPPSSTHYTPNKGPSFQITPFGVPDDQDDSDDRSDLVPPPPPPKDPGYSPYIHFAPQPSQSSLLPPKSSPNTPSATNRWHTFTNDVSHKLGVVMGSVSAASSQVSLALPPASPPAAAATTTPSKSKFRLPRLKRRPSTSPTVDSSFTATTTTGHDDDLRSVTGDDAISAPWGFQHNVHVDEELAGLPIEWAEALSQAGYSSVQIHTMYHKQQHNQIQHPYAQRPAASSSSSHPPIVGSSAAPPVVVPRPRKDSLRRLERPTKPADVIIPVPPVVVQRSSTCTGDSNSDDNVTIAVATPIRRSPSAIRRIPAPPLTNSPPPSYDALSTHGPNQTVISMAPHEKGRPQQHQTPVVTSPERSLPPPRASSNSLRQALQNTMSHARSSASLRTKNSDASSSRATASGSRHRVPSKKSVEGPGGNTFWDDDDDDSDEGEGADQISPLTPLGPKKSNRSLRAISSALPPRLELSLPNLDDYYSTTTPVSRKNSAESSAPSIGSSNNLTPKPSLSAGGSFMTLDVGGDLGLGDWGAEILKAVTTPAGTTATPETSASSAPTSVRPTGSDTSLPSNTAKHSSASSTVPSPNSFSTTFSIAPSASSQSSHLPAPAKPQPASSRPFSLYPVTPLNLPPHKKTSLTKPQPPLPPKSSSIITVTSDSQVGPNGEAKLRNKRLSRLMVHDVKREVVVDSPVIPPDDGNDVKRTPPPPTPAKDVLPVTPPPTKSGADSGRQLSILISEEYLDDDDENGLLPYMKGSPAPSQTAFPSASPDSGLVMSRSTSSSTSGSSSRGTTTDSTSFNGSTSVPVVSEYGGSSSTLTATALSPTADSRPFSSQTLTPAAMRGVVSRPVSSVPYDAVLDDWLEAEGEEDDERSGRPETVYEAGNIIDDALKSSPLVPKKAPNGLDVPPTPTITVNGAYHDTNSSPYGPPPPVGEEENDLDDLPLILAPLAPRIRAGNVRGLGHFQQVAEGQFGAVYAARAGSSKEPVAVKTVAVTEDNHLKFVALQDELKLLENVQHDNVLVYAGVFLVDRQTAAGATGMEMETPTLWLEMELMEKSLADVLAFVPEGLVIGEGHMARFANDILEGLDYLQKLDIAHRDVRSDNLLLSKSGVLKLADFSSATVTSAVSPKRNSQQGQPPYWMAPDMRKGQPYDPHEADIWSVGATIWEVAEGGNPPFIEAGDDPSQFLDRWPELSAADKYSANFHRFLELCSDPPDSRPRAVELLQTPFVRGACPVSDITSLLTQVREMEEQMKTRSIYS